jgi:5-(carboxyamino)imidazole ribonucleotide mutase
MPKALIIFGSKTDKKVYNAIADGLKKVNVDYDLRISSAHKTPKDVDETLEKDYAVVIAGAGLAAHLPGVIAAKVMRPVIGVPCEGNYEGLDALLSIAQMPPGIPAMAVGVGKGDVAAKNCAKMMKKYEGVILIGDKENKAVKKAEDILKEFEVNYEFSDKANPKAVNIQFVYLNKPVDEKNELVIYCALLDEADDKAAAALTFLKHTNHGLWVGRNSGVNAAIAAIEILNLDNEFEEKLIAYRREIEKKVLDANSDY